MTKTHSFFGATSFLVLLWLGVTSVPIAAHAAPSSKAFLGGGNALSRAVSGESQGLAHASSTSDLLSHLTFASTRGGRPVDIPPSASSTAETTAPASYDDEGSADPHGSPNGQAAGGDNGGADAGDGGDGGGSGAGGVVRAGSVASNAHAVNVLNTVLVRIGR